MVGGILFGLGWIFAGLGNFHFILTVLGVGLLSGFGLGISYLVPLAVSVQWFPKRKGLVSGVSLAGFGGGAALVTQIAGWHMIKYDANAFETLKFLGMIFLIVIPIAGTFMRFPQAIARSKIKQIPLKRVLGNPLFRLLFMTMFTGLSAGFMVNANMTKLYRGDNLKLGVMAIMLFAITNARGRVSWGYLFDKISVPLAIKMNLGSQALLFFIAPWILEYEAGFVFFALASGFNYGGLLVNHASASARYWGPEHVSQIYGWLSASNIVASLAPILAGFAFDLWGTFTLPFLVLAAALVLIILYVHKTLPPADEISRCD